MTSKNNYLILKEYNKCLTLIENMIGNTTTNNLQLEALGKHLFNNRFLGIYSANAFPKYVKNNYMFIINTDPISKPGQHWIACYKFNNKFYMYDTFNRNIKDLSKYWKHKTNIVSANKDIDQSIVEENCGQRAICWLILADKFQPNKIMYVI